MATLGEASIYKPAGSKTGLVEWGSGPLTTTDDTATQLGLLPVVAELEGIVVDIIVTGVQSDGTDQITARICGGARRAAAGNVTLTGTTTVTILESTAATLVAVAADTTNQTIDINVTGIAAETWKWEAFGTYFKV